MYKFKKSLIGLIGGLSLVAIATIGLPHIGRSASGTSNSAPTTQTQNVNVVNTPSVNAQQSGTWNVGISGTPVVGLDAGNNIVKLDAVNNTVKIDPAAPVLVRDVDNPARQPFQHEFINMFIPNGSFGVQQTYSVPAGKRLIIQEVSLQGAVPAGDVPWVAIFTTIQGANGLDGTQINLQFPKLRSLPNGDSYSGTVPVVGYADGGTQVSVTLGNQSGNGTNGVFTIAIIGYFIDLP